MGQLTIDELMKREDITSFAKDFSLKILSMDSKAVFSYDIKAETSQGYVTVKTTPRYLLKNRDIVSYFTKNDVPLKKFKSLVPIELEYN